MWVDVPVLGQPHDRPLTNLLWICLTCPRRGYGVGSVGYIHRRLVSGRASVVGPVEGGGGRARVRAVPPRSGSELANRNASETSIRPGRPGKVQQTRGVAAVR